MDARSEKDKGLLLRIATEISDGAPVDWEAQTPAASDGATRSKLSTLRLLETVADVHRAIDLPARGKDNGHGEDAPTRWGPLRIVGKIDRGGFAHVYRAFDPTLQREVALKLPLPGITGVGRRSADFINEARRLARVRHPNVVVVHGADVHEGRVGIWTDLVEGKTLEQCLREQGPFSAHEATLIGIGLCGALAAVHAVGLVHRDVKTSNVMREKGGRLVLMDFGSSGEEIPDRAAASGRGISGTPLSMAPEVLLKGEAPSRAADIYAMGVLLYRLVSGRFPIEAGSIPDLVEKHRMGRSTTLLDVRPDLPAEFIQVVERALSPDPAQRYPSAGAMERALLGKDTVPLSQPAPVARRRWIPYAVSAMVSLVCVSVWALWPAPLAVELSLYRDNAGVHEPLRSGSRIRPGDRLGLELLGSRPVHAYVLNEDARGDAFLLFPAGLDVVNPLPRRKRVQLPGSRDAVPQYWIVTSTGGVESILVIVSRDPLPQIEAAVAGLPRAGPKEGPAYAQLEPGTVRRVLRGIGGMGPSTSTTGEQARDRLSELVNLLPEEATTGGRIRVRLYELENPAP